MARSFATKDSDEKQFQLEHDKEVSCIKIDYLKWNKTIGVSRPTKFCSITHLSLTYFILCQSTEEEEDDDIEN